MSALRIRNELQEQRETSEQRPNNRETETEDQPSEQQQSIDWTFEDLSWIAQITQAAKCIYDDIVKDMGIMNKRDINTFVKKKSYIKKIDKDRLQYGAKLLIKTSPLIDPLQCLWEYNCSIFSVVKTWKSIHTKERNEDKERKTSGKPRWMINMERNMNNLRKHISRICEELKRMRDNCELTPKMKKNRSWMIKEIKGRITIASLTSLKINTIRALKKQKERKKTAYERFKTNQWFDVDEGSFYSHLHNIIKSTEANHHPQYVGKEKPPSTNQDATPTTTTTTRKKFEEFWRPIWETSSEVPLKQIG